MKYYQTTHIYLCSLSTIRYCLLVCLVYSGKLKVDNVLKSDAGRVVPCIHMVMPKK